MQIFPYEVSVDSSDLQWRGSELKVKGNLTQMGEFPVAFDSRTEEHPLKLGFRVFDLTWQHILFEGRAISAANFLEPGRPVAFNLGIPSQDMPVDGGMAVYIGLLYEYAFWFRDRGDDDGLRVHLQADGTELTDRQPLRLIPMPANASVSSPSKGNGSPRATGLEATVARLARSNQELEERVGKLERAISDLMQQFDKNVAAWSNYFPQLLNAISTSNASAKESALLKREVERVLAQRLQP